MLRKEVIPSLLIILIGSIDCVTTVIGVFYSGDKELNPLMASIVNTGIGTFLIVKIGATILIALTYIFARQVLNRMPDKNGRAFRYSFKFLTFAYAGLLCYLFLAVANNLLVLIR
jgi:hypothetical protein